MANEKKVNKGTLKMVRTHKSNTQSGELNQTESKVLTGNCRPARFERDFALLLTLPPLPRPDILNGLQLGFESSQKTEKFEDCENELFTG